MLSKLGIDLHKLAKMVNRTIPAFACFFLFAGVYISFYFHFLTVTFIFLTVINYFYLKVQTKHTVLRNFGVLGQGRYILESIGPELRQYLFSSDTEERPFNREERAEVYRKAKNIDSASSFGSQEKFDATEIKIRHSLYPTTKENVVPFAVTFGEERQLNNSYTITKPLIISAMSYGALGKNAVRALARGARLASIPINTGEGGYPQYHLMENPDLIFQMGTAKFGVRNEEGFLDETLLRDLAKKEAIKMIEIKLSQGAKPGKGGLLPKEKINNEIAELRNVSLGKDVVSPPHHAECKCKKTSIEFIKRIQDITELPVGIKLCIGNFTEFLDLIREMKDQNTFPDYIAVDGAEGGTGAAPKAFMDRVGIPLIPALQGVQKILIEEKVREKTKIIAAGKLINSGRQIEAMSLGADAIYTARGFMLALGCIQALQCGKNTCPIGITTHDPSLEHGLIIEDKATRVASYVDHLVHEFYELLAASGCDSYKDLNTENLYIPKESILAPYIYSQHLNQGNK